MLVSSGDNINMTLVLSFVHINKWIKIYPDVVHLT